MKTTQQRYQIAQTIHEAAQRAWPALPHYVRAVEKTDRIEVRSGYGRAVDVVRIDADQLDLRACRSKRLAEMARTAYHAEAAS